jgi:hypothetical protein
MYLKNIFPLKENAKPIEKCYTSSHYPPFVPPKLMWLLKSPLDQNSIMIYYKFNGDFKSHINFGRIKGGQMDDV